MKYKKVETETLEGKNPKEMDELELKGMSYLPHLLIDKELKGMSYLPHLLIDKKFSKSGQKVFYINDTKWSMGPLEK